MEIDQIKVVAYDCDGVLIDSRRANEAYYNHILDHFGLPPLHADQMSLVQTAAACEVIDTLFRGTDLRGEAQHYQASLSNDAFLPLVRLEPNVREVLTELKAAYRTALVTNRAKSLAPVLRHHGLEGLFDLVVSGLDVRKAKPDPEGLLMVLNYFSASPESVLYVGDSEIDRILCSNAGVHFVAYKNEALEAAWHVQEHTDILRLLLPKGPMKRLGAGLVNH